jgi:transposase InsO family protein
VPLPSGWTEHAKSGALHALGLARFALMHVRGWCANSPIARARLAAERDEAVTAASQASEEARILRTKLEALPAKKRPHYAPEERLAILMLRAGTGWTAAETARRFLVGEDTIASWMKRVDEQGENALLRTRVPVNRFPEYVGELVRSLRALQPALGKVRIADMLARAGLHLSPTTARRMLDRQRPAPEPEPLIEVAPAQSATAPKEEKARRVTARYPHHVWNIDITLLPRTGWWVPWPPQALPQRAPFCAWLVVVLDHFSRSVVGWKLFDKEPTAAEVHSVLDQARRATKATPKYTISDKGVQFRDEYKAWCKRRGVRPRFGAVGEHGSIAVLERFFRSLKTEMLRRLPWVPMSKKRLTEEVAAYMGWYDLHRPHQGLCGRTPFELRTGTEPARERRLEPRPAYPIDQRHDLPKGRRVKGELIVVVDHFEGRSHLPIVSLREAA